MYLIQIDHIVYGKRDGSDFSLVEAIRETHGCGHARILRTDGTVCVHHAGSDWAVTHIARDGRQREVRRRLTRRALRARGIRT